MSPTILSQRFGKSGSAIAKTVAPTLPTITIASFFGLSFGQIVLLGAASAMTALGMVLPDLITYWKDRQDTKVNGLSFLLDFSKKIENQRS